MTKDQLWKMFCNATALQRQAAYEVLIGEEGRPQFPLTKDMAIVWYGESPYSDDETIKRCHDVAVAVKPAYVPDIDITLIAAAGYQIGKADGKREERARKKASVERLDPVHTDLNTNHKGRSVSL